MSDKDRSGAKKEIIVPRNAYNEIVKLLHDKQFLDLIETQRSELDKAGGIPTTTQLITVCHKRIREFVHNRKLPSGWVKPIYNMIVKHILDFPLDNSIALRVGSEEITGSTEEILLVRNTKTGMLIEKSELSIVITSKISIDHIIRFIKNHKKEIEYWQNILGLSHYKEPNWQDINLALKIIRMKDEDGLSFSEIADKAADDDSLTAEERDCLIDRNRIKTIYYRYKKRLTP